MLETMTTGQVEKAAGWTFDSYHRVPRPMRLAPAPVTLDILFLYSRRTLPMARADEMTVAHLLAFFAARGHRVDLVSLKGKGEQLRPEHQRWLEAQCRSVRFVEQSRFAAFWRGGLGLLRGWPFQIGYLYEPAQLTVARDLAAERHYDLAYAYLNRSAEVLRALDGRVAARVLAFQVSQTLNTRRLAEHAAHLIERLFYRFESWRMAAYEARIWQIADRTVLIGEKDREAIEEACRQHGQPVIDNVVFGPHGVDVERFKPRPEAEEPDVVVMSGVMRVTTNVAAALWFLAQVWPRIRAARPNARFFLVGRDPTPALLAHHGKHGIEVTGTVDEPADWIGRATVCVVPIRAAAGLQNKLLEALAMGKAVVATPEANEGIQAVPGRDVLLAGTPEAFAAAVLDLLADAPRRRTLGAAGRTFVEDKWTWEAPFLALEKSFLDLHGERTERAARSRAGGEPVLAGSDTA
jgi:polysaccharide biosynthesis protein PslH